MEQAADTIATRVYHINYVRSSDIQALVTPLLTPGAGSISITAPASEGIAPDNPRLVATSLPAAKQSSCVIIWRC